MFLRINSIFLFVKYLLLGPLIIIAMFEWSPMRSPIKSINLMCSVNDYTCTRVLFIANPQIQGDLIAPFPLNYLCKWDNDRYLKSTFSLVKTHFKPDVIVFLGDLIDGESTTMDQFHNYIKRLMNIFKVDYPVMNVWLPGDNDIGGKNKLIWKNRLAEFEQTFKQPQTITYRNITFYKVNAMINSYPKVVQNPHDTNFKIVLSHYPILTNSSFGEQVDADIHANMYFCAHTYESKFVKHSRNFLYNDSYFIRPNKSPQMNFAANNEEWLHEIYVPTCSYKKVYNKVGYGIAVIENQNQNMRYSVLWFPHRLPHFIYLVFAITFTVYMIGKCLKPCLLFINKNIYILTKKKEKKEYPEIK